MISRVTHTANKNLRQRWCLVKCYCLNICFIASSTARRPVIQSSLDSRETLTHFRSSWPLVRLHTSRKIDYKMFSRLTSYIVSKSFKANFFKWITIICFCFAFLSETKSQLYPERLASKNSSTFDAVTAIPWGKLAAFYLKGGKIWHVWLTITITKVFL